MTHSEKREMIGILCSIYIIKEGGLEWNELLKELWNDMWITVIRMARWAGTQ